MSGGPEPSHLVLLSQLQDFNSGMKVRFLGCVHEYDAESAAIRLTDHFPISSADAEVVIINVSNILESLNLELCQVGAWINITGYKRQTGKPGRSSKTKHMSSKQFVVDAAIVWSAGIVNLVEYNAAVLQFQESQM